MSDRARIATPLRVVVAGASGFIGSRTVSALAAAGHAVLELARADIAALSYAPSTAGIQSIGPRLTAAFGTHGADILVWAAGRREPDLDANRAIHVRAPVDVRDALSIPRVVYLSTGEVYGTAPLPYREDGPALGTSVYAIAKLEGEAALARSIRESVEPSSDPNSGESRQRATDPIQPDESPPGVTILRPALVYGAGSKPPMLIPRVVAALRAGERLPLTHGEQTRDLVYIDDVARAIVCAVESAETGIFNIASGVEVRIRDVVEGIARAIALQQGVPADTLLGLLGFGEVALRPDEAHRYVMDVSRARDLLGWTATTSLADGLARI